MTDQTEPTPAGADPQLAELERGVDDARQKLAAMLEQQRAARTQVLLAIGVIVVILLIWGSKTYSMVKGNLSEEKLMAAAEQYAPHYRDQAMVIMRNSFAEAAPVYRELAAEKLKTMWPQIREDVKNQFQSLAEEIEAEANAALEGSLERIEASVDKNLREKFPYLAEGQAMHNLLAKLEAQHDPLVTDLQNMVDGEVMRVASAGRAMLERAFSEAAPVYRNLAIEKIKAMAPELRASAEQEVMQLTEDIQYDIDTTINASLARIEAALDRSVREKFPYATEGDVMENLMDQLHLQHTVIHADLTNIMDKEVRRARDVLVKFDVGDIENTEMAELEKRLLQTGLEYAMYELHVSGTDEGLNWDVLRAPQMMNLEPVGDLSQLEK